MAELRRMNIRVDDRVYEYFSKRSEETGVSMSSLIFLALEQYVDSKDAMQKLPDMFNQIAELEKKGLIKTE